MFAHTLQLCGDSIQTEHLFKQARRIQMLLAEKSTEVMMRL